MKTALLFLVLFGSLPLNEGVKHFLDFHTAMDYARTKDHKLMVLFTGYTASNRKMEELVIHNSEIDSLFRRKGIDVLVLYADDKQKNNAKLMEALFDTRNWPVCGIINADTVLISEKCFVQKDLKEKIKEVILSVK